MVLPKAETTATTVVPLLHSPIDLLDGSRQVGLRAEDGAAELQDTNLAFHVMSPCERRSGREGAAQVIDDVVRVFESDRQAHEAIRDPGREPLFRRHRGVSHGGRMGDQGLGGAEVLGEAQRRVLLRTRMPASVPPSTSKASRAPPPRCCRLASALCGNESRPG